jgi:transposase
VHILGVLDATENKARFTFSETLGAVEFIGFLQAVLKSYPNQKVHIVLDNARAHHSKLVQKFVQEHQDHLELCFLPPYSPMLNPIERFWQFLRESVTHNSYFESFTCFKDEITAFLRQFKESNEKIHQLCNIYNSPNPISVAAL